MNISSRTPEGEPNRCPICSADIRLEPSQPFGDAPCPCCGHLLWFLNLGDEPRYFAEKPKGRVWDHVTKALAEMLGLSQEATQRALRKRDPLSMVLANGETRSLDAAKLLMVLEDEFGPYEEA